MSPKSISTLLFLTLLIQISFVHSNVSAVVDGRKAAAGGGWKPISDMSAPEVQELARFAITQHNKEAKANLVLQSVDKGETKVVAGTDYRLFLTAENEEPGEVRTPGHYLAVVWVKPWLHYRNLTTFERYTRRSAHVLEHSASGITILPLESAEIVKSP